MEYFESQAKTFEKDLLEADSPNELPSVPVISPELWNKMQNMHPRQLDHMLMMSATTKREQDAHLEAMKLLMTIAKAQHVTPLGALMYLNAENKAPLLSTNPRFPVRIYMPTMRLLDKLYDDADLELCEIDDVRCTFTTIPIIC